MRRYRPYLVYNPARGWAFYANGQVSPFTHRTIGSPEGRKVMRKRVGWFASAQYAAMMERAVQNVRGV